MVEKNDSLNKDIIKQKSNGNVNRAKSQYENDDKTRNADIFGIELMNKNFKDLKYNLNTRKVRGDSE